MTQQVLSPQVTIVMSVHNGEKYLSQAVDSILAQTFRDFEFIIINDGSTDRTSEILVQYQARDARIRLLAQEQSGLVDALNRGCALARGEYIARMDADDVAFPQRIEHQVKFLENNPEMALVGTPVVVIDENGLPIDLFRFPTDSHEIADLLMRANCINHPTVMIRTKAFCALCGYRKTFQHAEDYDLWLRMSEQYSLANLAEPMLCYRIHGSQVGVEHLNQLVLSMLGARVSARGRRKDGKDPLANEAEITPAVLENFGVTSEQIQDAYAWAFLNLLSLLLKGNPEFGMRLAAQTPQIFQTHRIAPQLQKRAAEQTLDLANHHYSHKRFSIAKALVHLAFALDPQLFRKANTLRLLMKLLLGERGISFVSILKTPIRVS